MRTKQPCAPTSSARSKSQRRQSTSKQQPPLPPPPPSPIPPPVTEALPVEEKVVSKEVVRAAPTGRRRQSPTAGARGRQPSPSAAGRGRQPSPTPAGGRKSAPAANSKHHLPMATQTTAAVSRNPPHEGICADRLSCTSPPGRLSSPRRHVSPKRTSLPRQRPISPVPATIPAPGMIAMGMASREPLLAGRSPSPLPRAPGPMQRTPPYPNLDLNGFGPVPAWVGAPSVGSPRLLPKWTS